VRIEEGELIVGPLPAEERPASTVELEALIAERLPRIDLPTLLIEVDQWVNFTWQTLLQRASAALNRAMYGSVMRWSSSLKDLLACARQPEPD
jgi:hypothetical protein